MTQPTSRRLVTEAKLATDLATKVNTSTYTAGLATKAEATDARLTDQRVPIDGSVTDAKVAPGAAISADKLADGTTNKLLTATERTKLAGVATGATANATDAQLRDRTTHTGTQAATTITGLATVATTGAYGDLSGKPTLFDETAARALVRRIAANVENILDYGGVADGSTPNDAAYAAAKAAAIANGRPVYFPGSSAGWFNGAYAFTNPADILDPGLVVFGDGPFSTGIRALDPTKPVVRLGDERTAIRGFQLHHRETPTSTTGAGIELYKAFLYDISDVYLYRIGDGIITPNVNASTVKTALGSGNYAFSGVIESVRILRWWNGMVNLRGFNSASTGSVIRNVYGNNEEGSDVTTTLSSAAAAFQSTFVVPVAPIPGQVVYIDTAATVECRKVNSVTGTGPYTVTVDTSFDFAHSSGAAVTLSRRFSSAAAPLILFQCDEMALSQINIEGTHLAASMACLFQDTNVAVDALHFERVTLSTWQSILIRAFGKANASLRGVSIVFSEFRVGGGDHNRAIFSMGGEANIDVTGLFTKSNLIDSPVTMHLFTADNTPTGIGRLAAAQLGNSATTTPGFSPGGTNARTGLEFPVASYVWNDASPTRITQINDTTYRYKNSAGKQVLTGTAAPTTGTWAVGDTVWNSAPAAAGAPGWMCVTAGAPGTWKAMASLAA